MPITRVTMEGFKTLPVSISEELNEILWFAVSKPCRGKGDGRALLDFAVSKLNWIWA